MYNFRNSSLDHRLRTYKLVDIATGKVIRKTKLSAGEKSILNYAYALNGNNLRYMDSKENLSNRLISKKKDILS